MNRAQAARSAFWSAAENGGLALVSFLSLILYSRLLSVADFGVFSIVLSLLELLSVVVSMLFHDALVQAPEVSDLHYDSAFTVGLCASVVLLLACLLGAPAFGTLVGNPSAGQALRWAALALPFTALTATVVARQRRELEFRPLALRSLSGRLGGAAAGITLAGLGLGVWALVAQYLLIAGLGTLVLWVTARNRPRLRLAGAELVQLLRFGAFAVGALFLGFAVRRVFTLLVGARLGSEDAGYLNLSFRAVDVLWAIAATAVTQVALPILARLQSDRERLERAYRSALELSCLALYPCFLGIAALAPEIVEVLFGARWRVASPYVSALAVLIWLQVPRLLGSALLSAIGRPREALLTVAVEMALVVAPMLVLGSRSLVWAMAVWLLREVLVAPLLALQLRRATGIRVRLQLRATIAPLFCSLVMAAALLALRRVLPDSLGATERLLVLVPTGAALFLTSAWFTNRNTLLAAFQLILSARPLPKAAASS
jgi:PST family polysaccharide transporter